MPNLFTIIAVVAIFGSSVECGKLKAFRRIDFTETCKSDLTPEFSTSLYSTSHKLFSHLYESNGNKNMAVSPFAVESSLVLARMGASGETANKLDKVLSTTGQSMETIADNYNTMLNKYDQQGVLKVASKIYVSKSKPLQSSSKDPLTNKLSVAPEKIDFTEPEEAAKQINSWFASKTHDEVKNFISADSLSSDIDALVLNAAKFEGIWENGFLPENTAVKTFYITKEKTVEIPMMKFSGSFWYTRDPDLRFSAALLPYKNTDLYMLVILPHRLITLDQLKSNLKNTTPEALKGKFSQVQGHIHLPKFKADHEIELSDALKKVTTLISLYRIDLILQLYFFVYLQMGMETEHNYKIIHKIYLDITESGTTPPPPTGNYSYKALATIRFLI